jgi:hypothetical protein
MCDVALGWHHKESDRLFVDDKAFPTWVFLLRGTRGFVQIAGVPEDGPLMPLFGHAIERFELREAVNLQKADTFEPLFKLQSQIAQRKISAEMQNTYQKSIEELSKSFLHAESSATPYEMVDAFTWVYLVASDFLPLLQIPTPESIAIFSFFCVLLKKLDHHWWIRGQAEYLIAKAYTMLDEECRLWIRWPVEEIGWVPPSLRSIKLSNQGRSSVIE